MNSQVRYHRRRLADTTVALRLARAQVAREQGPRARLDSHQQPRLETVVRHAAAPSTSPVRGGHRGHRPAPVLALPVTLPLPRLVEALNQFQPTYLNVYPSVAMWLADEQAGCWSPTCTTWSNR